MLLRTLTEPTEPDAARRAGRRSVGRVASTGHGCGACPCAASAKRRRATVAERGGGTRWVRRARSSRPGVDVVQEAADGDRARGSAGATRTLRTSSSSAASWSSTTWKGCQEASMPGGLADPARGAPARCARPSRSGCAGRPGSARRRAGARRAPAPRAPAAVTRPPGLRKILASPGSRPSIRSGSIRESMQVTIATPAWATPSKPPRSKSSANSRLAASRSSKSATGRER